METTLEKIKPQTFAKHKQSVNLIRTDKTLLQDNPMICQLVTN